MLTNEFNLLICTREVELFNTIMKYL